MKREQPPCCLLFAYFAVSLLATSAHAVSLTRGPYIMMGHYTNQTTIVWRTDANSDSWVDYGLTAAYGSTAGVANSVVLHEVTLTGLLPGTNYYYRVRSGGVNLATDMFRSGKLPGKPVRIAFTGDHRGGGGANVGTQMAAVSPDLWTDSGDVTEGCDFNQFDSQYITKFWQVFRNAPVYWTPGNHEGNNCGVETSASDGAFRLLPEDHQSYAVEYGDVLVVCLNSEGLPGTAWLTSKLLASSKPWKIVNFHQPARTSSSSHSENSTIRDQYVPIMEQYKVDLCIAGHNHIYWRSLPINGISHLVVGAGGAPLYSLGSMPCYSAYGNDSINTFAYADIDGDQMYVRGIDGNGNQIDEFVIDHSCPFQLDGLLDSSAVQVATRPGGQSIYASIAGRWLYVATQDAGEGNDIFVFVAHTLGSMSNLWSWSKSGQVMAYDAFLADENDNLYSGWFKGDGNGVGNLRLARSANRYCNGNYLEGVIDLQSLYGGIPPTLYFAAAPYATANNGALVAAQQCPAGNGDANIDPAEFVAVNTASIITPFLLDGSEESEGYLVTENNGMKLWTAVFSNTLYVATWAAGNSGGANDHFIYVTDATSTLGAAPWAKAGQVAFNIATKPYLADESTSSVVQWANGGAAAKCAAASSSAGLLEGTIDLAQVFGAVPSTIYVAVAPYATADGGALVSASQVPAGNGDGNVDANEFIALSVSSIRDDNLDGVFDAPPAPPDTPTNVVATAVSPSEIDLTWSAANGAASYVIRRGGAQIGTTSSTSYPDTGLSPSTMYCYTVTATNASGASAESSPPACTTTQAPPPPPETPTNLVATAVSPTQINVSWASSSGATAYILRRDSVVITNTTSTTYSDTGRSPETQYCYTIAATNAGGSSAQSPSVCATTPSVPPFAMDGNVDSSGYLIAENSGMKLWAAIKGATLYVATWSPGTNGPNDHFILVTDQLSPLQAAFPDWSKVGLNAVSTNAPFLGGESTSDYVGWQKTSAANLAAKSATSAGQMEGTLDLVQAFGSMPSTLYLAVAPYATTNGGGLVASAQVPAGNGNGNIEGNEFLVVPVPVIRDDNLDGKLDSLDPTRAFAVQSVTPYGGTGFIVSWPSLPAHSYQVQYTDDMTVSFQPLSGTLVALQGQFSMSYTDSTSSVGRFYRVKLVTPQAQPASDNAADAAYGSVWTNGSNGGTGFGPWVLTGTGTLGGWSNGFFIASSTNNAAGATPGIDVSGKSWGIYANNGNYTAAYRALTNGALQVGQSLLVSMDNGYIDSGNTVGFVLRNGNASASPSDYNVGARFEFFYQGFATSNSYKVVDMAGLKDIGVPWTGTGLRLVFTLTGTDTYTLLTINNSSGTTNTSGGTLAGTGTVDSIALYNRNAGDGGNYDAFFNSLQTIGP